ncbi:MAG: hypothetical protein FJX54_20785 [Alphaproteobacteria bacterium]|nr:hypothetical protein [Alphaproteobacteria bacterium]
MLLPRLAAIALAASCAFASSAQAQVQVPGLAGTLSGLATVTSDYTFRGISQTDNDPAVQAGVEYGLEVGSVAPYLGIWGSNTNFADSNLELDLTGGVRGKVGEITWDLGFVYYVYPSARSSLNYDFVEGQMKLGYDLGPAALTLGLNYSPDFFASSGNATYLQANLDVPLPWGLVVTGRVGHQWIQRNTAFGAPDYLDWSLGVAKEVLGFNFGLAYVDTDLSKAECFAGGNLCDGRLIASVTKKF